MNKKFTFSILFFFALFSINAQDYVEVSVGASYANQTYYTLNDDAAVSLDNESWDLAFATGFAQAGILYNESAKTSFSGPVPTMRMYLAPTNDFADTFDPAALTDSLYNTEASWEDGAFNSVKDIADPFDFGWGVYDPGTHNVNGTKVYALKLRDGTWKKLKVESLSGGIYTIIYADPDGSNETTLTIDKADFAGSPLALFSFSSASATASPANWDILFARYLSPLDAGGEIVQYPVTGTLIAPGVEVAKARNINPETVDHIPYLDSMETRLDIIGHDWKFFDLGTFGWEINMQSAYFIKLPDNHLWKINFVDFEGSSSGTIVFQKTDLGELTAVAEPESNFIEYGVFPNPVVDEFNISFSLKQQRTDLQVYLVNSLGQAIWRREVSGDAGLNVLNFSAPQIPSDAYHMVVGKDGDVWTSTVFFK